jgi:hypothetical protein
MSKFTLPNGIMLDGKHFNLITLDEIRGKHQNMLVNPNPKTPIDFIEPILSDLILDLTDSISESILPQVSKKDLILHKLPIQDIQFILIKIRETSYGPDYLMHLNCTHCEAKNNAKLDLSTLSIAPRKDKISVEEMITPKDQTPFTYGHMSLAHLLKMAIQDGKSDFTKEMLTSLTAFMLNSLGDNKSVKPSDLDNLRGSDLNYIRDNTPELSEIDMKVEHTCSNPECGKDFEQELPALAADFLLHMRT